MSNFEVCAYLPYICVRLKLYPRNTPCIPACPVGLADRTGVVKNIAFLEHGKTVLFLDGHYIK
jgi:hypothetical protein